MSLIDRLRGEKKLAFRMFSRHFLILKKILKNIEIKTK